MKKRDLLKKRLHRDRPLGDYDNTLLWAGGLSVWVGDQVHRERLVRCFLRKGHTVRFKVAAELYVRGVTETGIQPGDLDVRAWVDVDDHGYLDQKGIYRPGFGKFLPMHLLADGEGQAVVQGNNVTFISDEIEAKACGVYGFTVEFSADDKAVQDPTKQWISVNEISLNRDGTIVVSPESVERCPSVVEICLRKCGSRVSKDTFVSGGFRHLTHRLERMPGDILYLLPFFLPGTGDAITGEDVRKGTLGSVYAVKDFYQVDPKLCSSLQEVDLHGLLSEGLITEYDLADLFTGRQQDRIRRVGDLVHFENAVKLGEFVGEDRAVQIVGRAELRRMVQRAHELGKTVIFDMVMMQTSRDNPLVMSQRNWYQLDSKGHPRRHKIAWLDYSDVALFDLSFNKPLQSYLISVVTYWMETADMDGIRIDAAQTVDRPFLKQLCNHVHALKSDAVVLGETLCPWDEALDVPTDMIYSVMVDHHVQKEHATPFIDLFEGYHAAFSPGTVAMAYFENHDSKRATHLWRELYEDRLQDDEEGRTHWRRWLKKACGAGHRCQASQMASLMKNIQATALDATAGARTGVLFSAGWELGSDYGEEKRTDFENFGTLSLDWADKDPYARLKACYEAFEAFRKEEDLLFRGFVYYFRENLSDGEDRILCFLRHDSERSLLCAFNLDPLRRREGHFDCRRTLLAEKRTGSLRKRFDAYQTFLGEEKTLDAPYMSTSEVAETCLRVSLPPLGTLIVGVDPNGWDGPRNITGGSP